GVDGVLFLGRLVDDIHERSRLGVRLLDHLAQRGDELGSPPRLRNDLGDFGYLGHRSGAPSLVGGTLRLRCADRPQGAAESILTVPFPRRKGRPTPNWTGSRAPRTVPHSPL